MYLKVPPRIKVLEALGAIADGRVRVHGNRAEVTSSEGDKVYRVCVDLEKGIANSTDNGTRFRSYVGYPIIAVLMLRGALPYDPSLAQALKGIPWKKLNEKYKKYAKVMELIFEDLEKKGIERERVEEFIDKVIEGLKRIHLRKAWCD